MRTTPRLPVARMEATSRFIVMLGCSSPCGSAPPPDTLAAAIGSRPSVISFTTFTGSTFESSIATAPIDSASVRRSACLSTTITLLAPFSIAEYDASMPTGPAP